MDGTSDEIGEVESIKISQKRPAPPPEEEQLLPVFQSKAASEEVSWFQLQGTWLQHAGVRPENLSLVKDKPIWVLFSHYKATEGLLLLSEAVALWSVGGAAGKQAKSVAMLKIEAG